jgi:hypothetical protein
MSYNLEEESENDLQHYLPGLHLLDVNQAIV